MSRQEIKHYGKQEFRRYPLVTLEPLPDQKNLADYYHRGAKGELGSRIKNMEKPLICGKTAKTYKFWDNLLYHYKHLYPLYGKPVEFKQFISVHDSWLFNFPENLKLHNQVCKFEQALATEVEKRVNIDNPDWVHPTTRNDARYYEDEEGEPPVPGVKKSRFLKKSAAVALSYKDEASPALEPRLEKKRTALRNEPVVEKTEKPVKTPEKNSRGLTVLEFPNDPDDLPPLPRPKAKNTPDYYGWSHSDEADSWYLEAHTPSIHEPYENFYDEALKKKVICPKFYSCV